VNRQRSETQGKERKQDWPRTPNYWPAKRLVERRSREVGNARPRKCRPGHRFWGGANGGRERREIRGGLLLPGNQTLHAQKEMSSNGAVERRGNLERSHQRKSHPKVAGSWANRLEYFESGTLPRNTKKKKEKPSRWVQQTWRGEIEGMESKRDRVFRRHLITKGGTMRSGARRMGGWGLKKDKEEEKSLAWCGRGRKGRT